MSRKTALAEEPLASGITLEARDDNSSEDAEKVVAWAHNFDGADAHIVYDYIVIGDQGVPGALNGVTIQWDHDDDGIPDGAVHVRPGQTVSRTDSGFEVSA